jgi:hypothetical protein
MEVKNKHSSRGCGPTGLLPSASHCTGWLMLLVRGIGLCSWRVGCRTARATKRPMYLAHHSLTRAQVSSHHFNFLP